MTYQINLGGTEILLRPTTTDAPADYDGFGTFTLNDVGDVRIVMIRDEHYHWQTIRYQSGNHFFAPVEDGMLDAITDAMWRKLQGTENN